MSDSWLAMSEAATCLGVSVRTLRRRLADGEYESKTEGTKKYVFLPDDLINSDNGGINPDNDGLLSAKDELIESLAQQVEYLQRALDDAKRSLDEAMKSVDNIVREHAAGRERTDTIILQQSNQLAQQQLALEDMRRSPWQRLKGLLQRKSSVMSTN